ncbi:hypothetical protein DYB35_014055 [Aphanomyces astaci]|uniref:Transposase Tc1-like domain-containing protein n=1 Tax=Aphanomyces astaci TaxID=112090 RepID=A0A3R6ZU34_APHAT|nr:hypothetical protein DYB35_014055 [Aphanomyces astaci]
MRATRNDLTEEVKRKVIKALQERVCLGKLPRGTMQAMATEFELDRGTIRELWRRFQQGCLKSRKYGHTGPTTRYTAEVVIAKIQEIPRIQRSNMRDISEASDISISTISRALKKGIIKHRSSRLKPLLTEENMRERLQYCGAHVVPAIKATFPSVSKRIVLQQDNATPHRSINDESLAKVSTDGWTFVIRQQPPNSPDLNVLDLGFFASIQSLQYKMVSRSVDDVIASTMVAFETLGEEKLSDVFLTLQAVMRLVLEHHGGNGFKLPHLHKDTMKRAGTLMENVSCPVSVLFAAHRFLQQ